MKSVVYVAILSLSIVVFFVITQSNLMNRTRSYYVDIHRLENAYPSSSPSKDDVVPFSAYFDRRAHGSFHNATVVLIAVARHLRPKISVGCEIDGKIASHILFRDTDVSGWINDRFKLTHTDCILYCYDMEVNRNSAVSVIYKQSGKLWSMPVRTAVVIPDVNLVKDSVMVCATGYGQPDYLDQWLVYQQSIKVQFIHLNVHESFLTNLYKSSMLRNLTKTGYVEILVWKEYLNSSQVYYYSQTFKYMDCLYRYQNEYRFMMLVDFDEYFIPFTAGMDVYSLAQWGFKQENIGSILLKAKRYYCKVKNDTESLINGNITDLYDTTRFIPGDKEPGKSIFLMQTIMELHAHRADFFFPPYKQLKVNNCYIAHFRQTKPCN